MIRNILSLDSVLDEFINAIKMLEFKYGLDVYFQTMKISLKGNIFGFI